MNLFRSRKKVLSTLLALLLFWTECFAAFPPPLDKKNTPNLKQSLESVLRGVGYLSDLQVPNEIQGPWVVNIQDIHGDFDAQKNIETMLKRMVAAGLVDVILLEGESRDLDFDIYRNPPDRGLVKSVSDTLLQTKVISGPAHLGFTSETSLPPMLGLEQDEDYRANIRALKKALAARERVEKSLAMVGRRLETLRKKYFDPNLFLADLGFRRYELGQMNLSSFLRFLNHQGVELKGLSKMVMDMSSLSVPSHSDQAQKEFKQLIVNLRKRMTLEESSALFDLIAAYQKNEFSIQTFSSEIRNLAIENNIPPSSYAHLDEYWHRAVVQSSFSITEFNKDLEKHYQQLLGKWVNSEKEEDVFRLSRMELLLKKMSTFSLSSDEYQELLTLPGSCQSKKKDIQAAFSALKSISQKMKANRDFYRVAEARNHNFIAKISKHTKKHFAKRVVVVSGGFHSKALETAMEAKGVPFFSCYPVSSTISKTHTFESLVRLANTTTLAPAPVPDASQKIIAREAIREAEIRRNPALDLWGKSVAARLSSQHGFVLALDSKFASSIMELIKNRIKSFRSRWYLWFGLKISGVSLHGGKPVKIRVYPRKEGSGIYFVRTDLRDRDLEHRRVPAKLWAIKRYRKRYSALEYLGNRIGTVEHLLAAMRVLNIWDADIHIDGEEPPILDGSAKEYIEKLSPLKSDAPLPEVERIQYPVVFRRSSNTTMIILPLDDDEDKSEFIFVGNYPGFNLPIESRYVFDDTAHESEFANGIGARKTFIETPLPDLQKMGLFLGAKVGENIIQLPSPEELTKNAQLARAVAEHKGGIDLIGDIYLWELTHRKRFRGRAIALGTGHRDNAENLLRLQSGYQLPFEHKKLMFNLRKLRETEKMSNEMFDYISTRLGKYKNFDEKDFNPIRWLDRDKLNQLISAARLEEGNNSEEIREMFEAAKQYLFDASGFRLFNISDSFASQQFVPEQLESVTFRVADRDGEQVVFEVSFERSFGKKEDWPRVALVVSKDLSRLSQEYKLTTNVGRRMAKKIAGFRRRPLHTKVGEGPMEYVPKMGQGSMSKTIGYGIYCREMFEPNFAFVVAGQGRDVSDPQFEAVWKLGLQNTYRTRLSDSHRKLIAKGIATMLTTAFLVDTREGPERQAEDVLEDGPIITGIDFGKDLLFDPNDDQFHVGLSKIRQTRIGTIVDLLDSIFHLNHTVEESKNGSNITLVQKWELFADYLPELAMGVEEALIRFCGNERRGKKMAKIWFKTYAHSFPDESLTEDSPTAHAWKYRRRLISKVNGHVTQEQLLEAKKGGSIFQVVMMRIAQLDLDVDPIKKPNGPASGSATAKWLVDLLTLVTRVPASYWIRLAPLTEAMLFPFFSSILGNMFGFGEDNVLLVILSTVVMGQLLWVLSHQKILIGSHWYGSNDGVEHFRNIRRRVYWAGLLIVGLPASISIFHSVPLTAGVYLASVVFHYFFSEGDPKENQDAWPSDPSALRRRQMFGLLSAA